MQCYDCGRVAANVILIAEVKLRGLRKTTTQTGLDRKTIRTEANRKRVKAATLTKVVTALQGDETAYLVVGLYLPG